MQVDIGFDQLIKIVRTLPASQWKKLKAEIDKGTETDTSKADLEKLLLKSPMATKKQLEVIENNRKAINQWRTK